MARRRTNPELDGDRESRQIALALGADLARTRRRRRLTQAQLGARVGIGRSRTGELERGEGESAPVALWVRLGMALGRPIAIGFSRDLSTPPEPIDAGHLSAQELVLGLAARAGRTGHFELPTRPAPDAGVTDVGIRDNLLLVLILVEIWNRLGDLGAASRSSQRKAGEVAASSAARGYRVVACWLLVDNAANRSLVRRYPAILRARFPGSSIGWVRALIDGAAPPIEAGIAWIDPRSGTITELRLRRDGPER